MKILKIIKNFFKKIKTQIKKKLEVLITSRRNLFVERKRMNF